MHSSRKAAPDTACHRETHDAYISWKGSDVGLSYCKLASNIKPLGVTTGLPEPYSWYLVSYHEVGESAYTQLNNLPHSVTQMQPVHL